MTDTAPSETGLSGLDALEGVEGLRLGSDGPAAPTEQPAAPGWVRRFWFVPAGVALLGAAALVPAVGGDGPGAGEARVLVDGTAVVTEADGDTRTVRDDRVDVGPGDEIAITEGRATFEMAGDVRLEGLGPDGGRPGTTVEMAVAPELVTGRLLAVAPEPLDVEAGDTTVSIAPAGSTAGAARLDRRLGLGVGTYRGRVELDTAGRQAEVPRYRRVEVAAPGALGAEGRPLRYEADDAWDRRFLGEALVIDSQVAPLLAALAPAERDRFLDPATLRQAIPDLPAEGLAARLAALDDGGEALVLAAIALAVDDGSFATAWDEASDFQADGAPWGLAALDQGARSADVLPTLRGALDTLDLQAPAATDDGGPAGATEDADGSPADGTGTEVLDTEADAGGAPPTTVGGSGTPTDPGGGGGLVPGVPTPTVPGVTPTVPNVPLPTVPQVPTVPEVVEGVGGGVGEVVDGVTDGVDGVLPGVGEVVDDVVGGLGGVVDGLGGAIEGVGEVPVVGPILGGLGTVVGSLGTGLNVALGGQGPG